MANGNGKNKQHLKDSRREQQLFTRRAVLAGIGVTGLLGVLGTRMTQLQVAGHQRYMTMSQANRVRLVPVAPNRGLIYDRNGLTLAENRPNFQLLLTPEQIQDMNGTLDGLRGIMPISDRETERFTTLMRRSRRFEALPLKVRMNEDEVAAFAVHRHRFPGVEVEARLSRFYPQGPHAVHAVGYVGRINERDLQRLESSRYAGTNHTGKTGAELQFEDILQGYAGMERVETNALGRAIRPLERAAPNPGQDIYLTIDSRLQRVAEDALGDYAGSIVVIDVRNGDVLALASKPMYDPNLFVNGIDVETYRALQADPDKPLFNRAIRGQYPPGSTIKPFVGLAGRDSGTVGGSDRVFCRGHYSLPGIDHRWRCWRRQGHGHMNFIDAMAQSCDVYYYDLAYRMGIDRMQEFLGKFGFGRLPGLGTPGELGGILPSREWKRGARGEPWFHGETLITGIGQGYFLTTPLQLAQATAVIANRCKACAPRLVRAVHDNGAPEIRELEPNSMQEHLELRNDRHWDELIESMVESVHGRRGTGRGAVQGLNYRIAGKTGTAQVFSLAQDQEYDEDEIERRLRDHALFNCFAPVDEPRISVAVIVENGGSGGGVAAPMARQVTDAYMDLIAGSTRDA
ncbi:MAG: penicillin-binding protein 2 [Ectothiorhodospiraceae bacterium]|nr:penicillin-binding protein 2 [Ectothiorhodospiraceae bacterium]